MSLENPEPPPSALRRLLPCVGALLMAAVIVDGVIFYSRWSSARELEQAKATKEAADASSFLKIAGGNELKILAFYSSPGRIQRGEKATLCYGVNKPKQFASIRQSKKYGLHTPTASRSRPAKIPNTS